MENLIISANEDVININTISNFLNDSEQKLLSSYSNIVEFSKRDTIIKQNSRASQILFINSGLVKLSKEIRKGKSLMLNIEGPGKFIGLNSAFGNETYQYSITAIEQTKVSFIDSKIFKDIINQNGKLGVELISQICRNNNTMTDRLSSLLYKQLPGRVADIIIYFSEVIYKSDSFIFPLTRQELAELAGTTKESIIRTLSEFKHDKIIDMDRNSITILSPKIIQTLSRLG